MKPTRQQFVTPRAGRSYRTASQRGAIDRGTATAMFGIVAVVLIGMFSFFYLQQVVHTASQGADVSQLEAQISSLKEQQKTIELDGARLRSLQTIQEQTGSMNLVPTDSVSYLAPTDGRVAVLTK
ncbi:MAG: hypothetical protein A3E36_01635 [Candidatus Andersenbacteria bacterium RIFCSPHIGHO2_12_FULL_45_11b]|uniref:Cell division protein FtsL n=1 Tax=Candidatus Andersenbacteria bacterium RIFCSPHIGHO2_12_FULL_45_11b TaxID=1797282 RepID=A0A1G1XA24_9BACT|nr:MAG: hypothetical protein A3E36_01635 [Candidatus Andersenbacteria bacterium RIFCSPHIGHO2_12_FULL_45_11b]